MPKKPKNIVGQEFATLEVLEYAYSMHKTTYWRCKCKACGQEVTMAVTNLRSPNLRSCGCLKAKPGSKHKNWKGCGDIPASYLCKIKSHAKRRGITVELTVEYLWELFQKQGGRCALSGQPLTYPQSFQALSAGEGNASLDRIDSDLPYREGNVQWVDKTINFMKHQLSQSKFVEMCRLVADHQAKENK